MINATAPNFEFKNLISEFLGYDSAKDPTNVSEATFVRGSQNVYKKLSGTVANRPGLKRRGDADTTLSPISSEYVWNTSWGATRPLRVSNSKLSVEYENAWYDIMTGLTKTRFIFDKWYDSDTGKDNLVYVDGSSNLYSWSGGIAKVDSSTSTTLTKTGTNTWQQDGFNATVTTIIPDDTGEETENIGKDSSNTKIAQAIEGDGNICASVTLYLEKVGTPSEDLLVSLYNSTDGLPGDTLIASGSIGQSEIGSGGFDPYTITFTTPAVLEADTTYWLVLDPQAIDPSNYYEAYAVNTATYAPGAIVLYNGANWSSGGSYTLRCTLTSIMGTLIINGMEYTYNGGADTVTLTGINSETGLGEELIYNGNFDGNADGWTILGSDWYYDDYNVRFINEVGGYSLISAPISFVAGKTYRVSFEAGGDTGSVFFGCYPLIGEENIEVLAGTTYSNDFVSSVTDDGYVIQFNGRDGHFGDYDYGNGGTITNVSIKEVINVVLQKPITHAETPSIKANDFLKTINNQVYLGSYTSRLVYISASDDYLDYTVPTPRVAGSPELLTLDGTVKGIGVRQGKPYIGFGTSKWAIITYNDITVGTDLTQSTTVDVKPVSQLAGPYAHEFIDTVGDTLIYLSQDKQVRTFGDFKNLFTPNYPSISQQINTELSEEDFTGGGLRCIGDFVYLTAPVSGKTYLYQARQQLDNQGNVVAERLWHAPQIWNLTRVDEIDGVVYGYSNANPQLYQLWDTGQWNDDSPADEQIPYRSVLRMSYRTGGRRQGLQCFDKTFSEGYLSQGTNLNIEIKYNYQGSLNTTSQPINSSSKPAFLFEGGLIPSLGDSSIGDVTLGDGYTTEIIEQNTLPKFKVINCWSLTNCFEYQITYSTEQINARWEILATGTNAQLTDQIPSFIINK